MNTPFINWLKENNIQFGNNTAQQSFDSLSTDFIVPLTDYAIIRVTGVDAEKFMQGQFSCDITEVSDTQSRMGTANTPKGRAYTVFRIAKLNDDYLIRLPADIAGDVVARLNKFIVFFKAQLILDEPFCVLGAVGDIAEQVAETQLPALPQQVDSVCSNNHAVVVRVPSSTTKRYEIWCNQALAKTLLTNDLAFANAVNRHSDADWYWFDIAEGIPEVYQVTQEQFIPQMLNLQHLNAISFKKGCYTGQEIIARMKYLGKLKKAMYLLAISSKLDIRPNAPVFEKQSNKKLGSVVRAITSEPSNETLALVVLDIESAKAGVELSLDEHCETLELGEKSINLLTLPYVERQDS